METPVTDLSASTPACSLADLSQGQRKLAAIMFVDMVGYTSLGQKNEELSLALIDEQRKLIRPILSRHNGKEVKTIGDALLVQFPNALDVIRCSYDIQRAIKEFNLAQSQDKRFHLRIGVHLGDVVENEADIMGDAVNVASRIEPLAEAGGVCLSRQVYDQVRGKVDLQFSPLGVKALKNVIEPVEIYRMILPWDTGGSTESRGLNSNRIAVLPFANMSPDPQDEYFADGLTEEIISTISRVNQIEVISRTSVMQFKKMVKSVKDVGEELDVGMILEGSVRKAGNKLRITVLLVDAIKDKHVWAESFNRDFADIFEIQSEIAQKVADSLKLRLDQKQKEEIVRGPTQNLRAYNSYLTGLFYLNKTAPKNIVKCIPYFERAIAEDPNFAQAYSGLANTYVYLSGETFSPAEAFPKAKSYAEKTLSIDDGIAEAHWALANIAFQSDWNWDLADSEYRKALELNPNSAPMIQDYAIFLMMLGRDPEAIREINRALELDPMSGLALGISVVANVYAGHYSEALALAKKRVGIDPNDPDGHNNFSMAYSAAGYPNEAYDELRLARRQSHQANRDEHMGWAAGLNPWIHAIACTVLASVKKEPFLQEILEEAEDYAKKAYVSSADLAIMHLGLGNTDRALDLLEEGVKLHDTGFIFVHRSQVFDPIRSHPRFIALLKRCNLPLQR